MSTRQDTRRYRSNETECENCGHLFRDTRPGKPDKYEPALCRDCRNTPDLNRR